MARYNDDLDGYSTGTGVPTGMTENGSSSNVTYEIVTDGTSPGGQALEIAKTGAGRTLITIDAADGDNQSAVALLEKDSNGLMGLWINGSGGPADYNGYVMEIDTSANGIALYRGNGGSSFTQLDTDSMTLNPNVRYWARICRLPGDVIVGRVWESGDAEPTTWNVSATGQTAHTTGYCGVHVFDSSGTTTILHRLSVGTGADHDQGCTSNDDQFPLEGLYFVTREDDALRVMDKDGSPRFLIAINNENLVNCDVHDADQEVYCADYVDGILRYDRYGLGRTVITSTTGLFNVSIDQDGDRLFYGQRINGTQNLYKNAKGGGSQTSISTTSGFFTAGDCYYNADDGLIYWCIHTIGRSMDDTGTTQDSFPSFSDMLTIVADGSDMYASTWNAQRLASCPINGSSWTNIDTTSSLWGLDFNTEKTRMYAGADEEDNVIEWTSIPPSAGNRTNLLTSINSVQGLAYFTFTESTGSGSGAGSGSGSGSGSPGSGSGVPLPPFNTPAFKKEVARVNYERLVVYIPRSGAVVDISGREGIIGPAPAGSLSLFKGSYSFPEERSSTFEFRSLKQEAAQLLRVMSREGCKARYIGIGTGRHQGGFVDMNLNAVDARDSGSGFGGLSLSLNSRLINSGSCQFTNLLECFPWRCSEAVEETSEAGSGSGSGQGSSFFLEPIGDHEYEGPKWEVGSGENVDSIGTYFGTLATLEIVLPIQGASLQLRGEWTGSVICKNWLTSTIETISKTTFEDEPSFVVPDFTWSIQFIVDTANNPPCVTINAAGASLAPRVGACLDCTDPDAVPAVAPFWTDDGQTVFFIEHTTERFFRVFGTFDLVEATDLVLVPSIIDMDRDQFAGRIYGLSSDAKVYSWKDDGSDFGLVFDTGFGSSTLERIHIDNVGRRIVMSTHAPVHPVLQHCYIYSLTGTPLFNFEQRWQTNSISQGLHDVALIGGATYNYVWDNLSLYRFDLSDGDDDFIQSASGLSARTGLVDDLTNTAHYVIGSAMYQFNPVTVNNPSNGFIVGGGIPTSVSKMDFFNYDQRKNIVGCGSAGTKIFRFNVNSGTTHLDQTTQLAKTLCTKHDYARE